MIISPLFYMFSLSLFHMDPLIENTLILPGYTLSKQSIVDLQSIVVIFVELLLNMFHNTLKED